MIDEQLGPERRRERLQQAVGHRRAGEAELAHRADVARGEQRVMHQVVIERRHEIEIGHPFGRDRSQRPATSKRRRHMNAPPTSDMASSERTPMV